MKNIFIPFCCFLFLVYACKKETTVLPTAKSEVVVDNNSRTSNELTSIASFSVIGVIEETNDVIAVNLSLDNDNTYRGTENLYGTETFNIVVPNASQEDNVDMIRNLGNNNYRVTLKDGRVYELTNVMINDGEINGTLNTSNSHGTVLSQFSIISDDIMSGLDIEYSHNASRIAGWVIVGIIGGIITTASCAYERSAARMACQDTYNTSTNSCGCQCNMHYTWGWCGGECEVTCHHE